MLAFVDDSSFPKIRRSIFLVSSVIMLLAVYDQDLKFPEQLFSSDSEVKEIKGELTIFVLWVVQAYLMYRYEYNLRASKTIFKASLNRDDTGVKKEAKDFLKRLVKAQSDLQFFVEEFPKVAEELDRRIKDYAELETDLGDTGRLAAMMDAMHKQLDSKNRDYSPKSLEGIEHLKAFDQFHRAHGKLMQRMQSGLAGFNVEQWEKATLNILKENPLSNFAAKVSEQEKAENDLANDQFKTADIAVMAVYGLSAGVTGFYVLGPHGPTITEFVGRFIG